MKAKESECVRMKRRGAEIIYEQTKDMTPEEKLEFWKQRTDELRKEQEELRRKKGPTEEP